MACRHGLGSVGALGWGGGGTWGGGGGIMGMWEFGAICELLFKLPKVGVGAFVFAPNPDAEKNCSHFSILERKTKFA